MQRVTCHLLQLPLRKRLTRFQRSLGARGGEELKRRLLFAKETAMIAVDVCSLELLVRFHLKCGDIDFGLRTGGGKGLQW